MTIPLREDFDAAALHAAARRTKDAAQARRLLALAAVYDGSTRSEAAKIGGVTLQIVRDWVMRFNAEGPDGLIDRKPPGPPPRLNDVHRRVLVAVIESGPVPAVHGAIGGASGVPDPTYARARPQHDDADLSADGPHQPATGFIPGGSAIPVSN